MKRWRGRQVHNILKMGTVWVILGTMPLVASSAEASDQHVVRFSAVGDIVFGRGGKSYGTNDPLAEVKPLFAGRDLVMANLETPITPVRHRLLKQPCSIKRDSCKTEAQRRYQRLFYLTFHAPAQLAQILKDAGISLLVTANNHAEDQGKQGIVETLNALKQQQLQAVGSGATLEAAWEPYVFRQDGISIGVIAATTVQNFPPRDHGPTYAAASFKALQQKLPGRVRKLKQRVDFVIVTLHYSSESVHYPSSPEKKLAAAIAQAGADVFIGTHPHVLRGISFVGEMVAFWSLGNFVFDTEQRPWRETGVANIDFVKNANGTFMRNITFSPVLIRRTAAHIPQLPGEKTATAILNKVLKYSKLFRMPQDTFSIHKNILHISGPESRSEKTGNSPTTPAAETISTKTTQRESKPETATKPLL